MMTIEPIIFGKKNDLIKKVCQSNVKRAKIIALAFTDNFTLITSAINQVTRGLPGKWTMHAEESLVKKLYKLKARERFGNINVLVMRWSVKKDWTLAKPCKKCQKILKDYGIEDIYFTNENGTLIRF